MPRRYPDRRHAAGAGAAGGVRVIPVRRRRPAVAAALLGAMLLAVACGGGASRPAAYRVGVVLPLQGPLAPGGHEEFLGVDIARELVNADGGVGGRQIALDTQELDAVAQAQPDIERLRADGVDAVIGAFNSQLSIPASASAAVGGLVYWEAGAVADRVTGRGLPLVFRVGATGANLGSNSGRFAVEQLAPRLGRPPSGLRVSFVVADDEYAHSVADAARARMSAAGMAVASTSLYDPI